MINAASDNLRHNISVIKWAILSAILFGLSTPFAKMLTSQVDPIILAGCLYLSSGLGLFIWYFLRKHIKSNKQAKIVSLAASDYPYLAVTVLAGGMIAPTLLMVGLTITPSSTASLLLNFEIVFTFLIAAIIFRESFDTRMISGSVIIIFGGLLLSWPGKVGFSGIWGPICIGLACLAWGIDNNITRQISAGDPIQIAAIKGLVAGFANLMIGFIINRKIPGLGFAISAAIIGLLGYGLSLVFFILSLRHLGTARTSAYFAAAPFIGALASFLILGERLTAQFALAMVLIISGIYMFLSERHAHQHTHRELIHEHSHTHDEHHRHIHDEGFDDSNEHVHRHEHREQMHSHPHYPDIHHRHTH